MNTPEIKVQLVHIDGPLKGEIQEFFEPVIAIGRHPECQLVFPKDCTAISRKHAEIRREGNRFKFVDHSANGTLINGKQQKEVFLKNGDVLIVGGEGGPKVSFLSSKVAPGEGVAIASFGDGAKKQVPAAAPLPVNKVHEPKDNDLPEPVPVTPPVRKPVPMEPPTPSAMQTPRSPEPVPAVTKTFIIQYGATLTSFKHLPITIGSGSDCDCTLQHPALLDRHAQVFFRDNQYWVKDLTGRGLLTVNMQSVQSESPLMPDTCLALTANGPKFKFIGEGRLAEIETTEERQPPSTTRRGKQQRAQGSRTEPYGGKNIFLWIIVIVLGLGLTAAAWYYLSPSLMLKTPASSPPTPLESNREPAK